MRKYAKVIYFRLKSENTILCSFIGINEFSELIRKQALSLTCVH